ncbi:hypothetical protein TIFTF001_020140 [Ficus carica]|uniref:Uncharacterized protein n=1 Tax=Ficus carica TaxID=3494 RepID=A0AA88AHP8_FICCA|nr:hypothetical protein TIFTF001_020140 [Ficus carica]
MGVASVGGAATSHVSDITCKGLTVRVGNIVPRYYLTRGFVVGSDYAINSSHDSEAGDEIVELLL